MNKTSIVLIGLLLFVGCAEKQKQINTFPDKRVERIKINENNYFDLNEKLERAFSFQKQRDYKSAIEIYDSIINQYKNREDKRILESIYINKFECELLSNSGYDRRDIEDFLSRFGNNPKSMKAFEILYILDSAKNKPMDIKVEEWVSKYKNYRLNDWTFVYIDDWIKNLENSIVRNRLNRYVSIFKKFI